MSEEQRSNASLSVGTAVVFLAGFVMETYGLYSVLASGAVLKAFGWLAGGLLLQVASGVFGDSEQGGTRLTNPFGVLNQALRKIRKRVQGWDHRE